MSLMRKTQQLYWKNKGWEEWGVLFFNISEYLKKILLLQYKTKKWERERRMLADRDTSLGFLSPAFFSGLLSSAAALLSFLGGRGETSSTFFFVFSDSLSLSFVGSTFPTTVSLFSAISVFTSSTPEKEEPITNVVSVQRNLKIVNPFKG